jgi:hypothetical protein
MSDRQTVTRARVANVVANGAAVGFTIASLASLIVAKPGSRTPLFLGCAALGSCVLASVAQDIHNIYFEDAERVDKKMRALDAVYPGKADEK